MIDLDMGPRHTPNDSTDAGLRCVELGCNVDLPHTSGIEAAHLQNIGSRVFCVPMLLSLGSDFVHDSPKRLEPVQSILRNGTNLKVLKAIVILYAVVVIDNHAGRYFPMESLHDGPVDLVQLACFAGACASPSDEVGIPVFVVLKLQDAALTLHSSLVGNTESVVKRKGLPSLFH